MTVALGPWEKYFFQRGRRGGLMGTSVLARLDRRLDPERLRDAAAAVRHVFPVAFSRIEPDESGRRLRAVPAEDAIERWVGVTTEGALGWFRGLMERQLAGHGDLAFRVHCGVGDEPFLAFHASHVMGDARTFVMVRDALVAAYEGRAIDAPGAYAVVGPDRLRRMLPSAWPGMPPLGHRQTPVITLPKGDSTAWAVPRLARCTLDREQARALVRRSLEHRVTPLAWLAGCLAVAMSRVYDPWYREPGDYFAINVPIDIRPWCGLQRRPGNLVYPLGLPIVEEDVADVPAAARAAASRLASGLKSYAGFHDVGRALARAADEPLGAALTDEEPETRHLEPLEILGVTEFDTKSTLECIGDARVTDYLFESPIVVRRPHGDGSQLLTTLRWHPMVADRINSFLETLSGAAVSGDPSPSNAPAWTLI